MPTASPLIDAASLKAALDAGHHVVVIDASFSLADAEEGAFAFEAMHIPGALYAHLDDDLSAPKDGRNGRHPLPPREAFAERVARWGITPATPVVVYDRSGAMYAARLWWMLRWIGHAKVWVLDGGWAAWLRAGGAVESGEPRPVAAAVEAFWPDATMPTLDADAVQAMLGRDILLDARTAERFRGEIEPLDPVAGHIPGALNRPFQGNLDAEGRFRAAAQLRTAFEALLGERSAAELVHQCGSGVTACHNLLAMEIAGLPGSALYPGSWSEWCADPTRPVARG
jgi:thiosulfate/3-mercaptopyruvate sulfurtransferase